MANAEKFLDCKQHDIVVGYLIQLETSRLHEKHPAVRALRVWYDKCWHNGKQWMDVDSETIYAEAVGSQRYVDLVKELIKLPAVGEYDVYDSETDFTLDAQREKQTEEFIYTPPWQGHNPVRYGQKNKEEIYRDYSGDEQVRLVSSYMEFLDNPVPDDRPLSPPERFIFHDEASFPRKILHGQPLMFDMFVKGMTDVISQATGGSFEIAAPELPDNSEYSVLSIDEEVDCGMRTGRKALVCELGGIEGMTVGWNLVIYPK